MIYDAYEVVKSETRTDAAGDYFYAAIAAWENLADKQANGGQEFSFDGQIVKARLANDFKVRYAATGTRIVTRMHRGEEEGRTLDGKWLPLVDETRTEEPDWEREQFARDTSAEAVECVQRYLARIANSAEYQQKVAAKPDRRGTTLNLQVSAGADDGYTNIYGLWTTSDDYVGVVTGFVDSNFHRFTGVSGLSGTTIDAADFQFQVVGSVKTSGQPKTRLFCDDAASPAAPTTWSDYDGRTTTTAYVDDVESTYSTSTWYTHSITAIVQELADSYDPSTILTLWKDNSTTGNYYYRIQSYDTNSSLAAKLDIDYTAGGGGMTPIGPASQRIRMKRHGSYLRT